jgi:hypothetical protein
MFKKIILLLCIFAMATCAAASKQERFLQAQELYAKQDYAGTLVLLEGLEHKGAAVWHNLGCCYAKQGDKHKAVWAWRNAQARMKSRSALAMEAIIADYTQHRPGIIDKFLLLSPFGVQLCWLLIFAFLLFMAAYFVITRRYWRVCIAAILLCSWFVFGVWYNKQVNAVHGILLKDVVLRAGPDGKYPVLCKNSAGTFVRVTGCENGWQLVCDVACSGWVPDDEVGLVPEQE